MTRSLHVVVTARDEAATVGSTLAALRDAFPDARLVLADDGSRDATAEIAAGHGAAVVGAGAPRGKGQAATDAARHVLGDSAGGGPDGIVLFCDADLGASAGRLVALVEAVEGDGDGGPAPLAIAAFAVRAGGGFGAAVGFAGWSVRRRTGLVLQAPLSGQRALGADVLPALLPFASGFGMEVGMTIDAVRAGCRVVEVPLALEHRVTGRTAAGFAHRGRQLADVARAFAARRGGWPAG